MMCTCVLIISFEFYSLAKPCYPVNAVVDALVVENTTCRWYAAQLRALDSCVAYVQCTNFHLFPWLPHARLHAAAGLPQ